CQLFRWCLHVSQFCVVFFPRLRILVFFSFVVGPTLHRLTRACAGTNENVEKPSRSVYDFLIGLPLLSCYLDHLLKSSLLSAARVNLNNVKTWISPNLIDRSLQQLHLHL